MSTMDVSVVLRLIDELTAPAKAAGQSISDMQKRLTELATKGAGAADALPKNLMKAAEAAKISGLEIQRLTQRYESVTNAIRGMKAAEGLKVRGNWVSLQVKELDKVAAAAKRAEEAQRRAAGVSGAHGRGSGWLGGYGLLAAGPGVLAGYQAMRTAKTGLAQAFSLQQTRAMLQAGGENEGTINEVVEAARKLGKTNHQYSVAEHAHSILKLRSAIGDMREAIHLAPAFQQANAVLNAAKDVKPGLKNMHVEDQAYDMARALEIKGVTRAGEAAISSYMNSMTKAIIGMSGQIDAGDFHNTFKYGRAATRGWSQDFVENYLPTLMNEFKSRGGKGGGVQGPGNALMSMFSTVVDERIGKKAIGQWKAMGLIGKDGHVVGRNEFIENPYLWSQKHLTAALKKKLGSKAGDETAIIRELGGLFGNRVAAQIAQIMTIAKSQFEKDRDLIQKAAGFDALETLERSSPQAAMQGMAAAWKDMLGAFANPGTGSALRIMHGLAAAMRHMSKAGDAPGAAALSGKLDQFLAGLFGQSKFAPIDPNQKNQGRGGVHRDQKAIGDGSWFNIGRLIGNDFAKFGDDLNKGLSDSVAQWRSAVALANSAGDAFRSAMESVSNTFYQADKWLRDKLSWIPGVRPQGESTGAPFGPWQHNFKPGAAPKLPGMLDPNTTVPDPSQKRWYQPKGERDYTLGNGTGGFSHGPRHTYGGIGQVTETFQEGLKNLPTATVPDLSDIGTRIMQSVSSGMQKSAGVVTGQMQTLMGSLQGIAAGGINIPVHLDSGGVSGQVRGAIQKANAGARSHGPVTINVQGDHNPHATAQKVRTAFNDAVRDHLNDIG